MAKIVSIRNADGSTSYGAHVSVKGFKRTWQSFPTKKEATAWRDTLTAELRKQPTAGAVRPDIASATLAGLNSAYLSDPKTQSLGYFRCVKRHLEWWSRKYGAVRVLDFGVVQLLEARKALMPGRANATVVRTISSQRSAWNWGRRSGYVLNERVWPTGLMLTEPDARVRYLSDDELKAVLAAATAHSPVMYAAIAVALGCGVRRGEMLRLTWGDVDFEQSKITLLITKNGTSRSVHLPSFAVAALKDLKADHGNSERVFRYQDGTPMDDHRMHREWKRIRKTAGLIDFRWHDLRHSCASLLAQNGANLLEIGSVLGHKSADMSLKYAHLQKAKPVTGHAELDAKLRASVNS